MLLSRLSTRINGRGWIFLSDLSACVDPVWGLLIFCLAVLYYMPEQDFPDWVPGTKSTSGYER